LANPKKISSASTTWEGHFRGYLKKKDPALPERAALEGFKVLAVPLEKDEKRTYVGGPSYIWLTWARIHNWGEGKKKKSHKGLLSREKWSSFSGYEKPNESLQK